MLPPWFAIVDAKTGTPVNETVIAFFTKLDILSNLHSVSTLIIFMLVALALLVRHYYVSGVTTSANRNKLIACLVTILVSSSFTAGYWGCQKMVGLVIVSLSQFGQLQRFCSGILCHKPVNRNRWTGLLLVYYFMFGLHAADEKQWSKVEGGQMKNAIENKDGDDK
ncbi:hypothetical protein Tco_0200182 [Tanacetum coccineum]